MKLARVEEEKAISATAAAWFAKKRIKTPIPVFELIKVYQAKFSFTTMCRLLRVSRSGHYSWLRRGPSRWAEVNQQLLTLMQQISQDSNGCYGVGRIKAILQRQGNQVNLKRISRFKSTAGLYAGARRRRVNTTHADGSSVDADLVQQELRATIVKRKKPTKK